MGKKQLGALDAGLIARVDAARGDIPRIVFVRRALEAALEGGAAAGRSISPEVHAGRRTKEALSPPSPASPRVSVPPAPPEKPTPIQLSNRARVPVALATRWLQGSEWEKHWP